MGSGGRRAYPGRLHFSKVFAGPKDPEEAATNEGPAPAGFLSKAKQRSGDGCPEAVGAIHLAGLFDINDRDRCLETQRRRDASPSVRPFRESGLDP